jgi:nitrite reductase/ring-hydroxylating ferredoxin subunit
MTNRAVRKIEIGKKDDLRENQPVHFHFGPIKGIAIMRSGECKAYVNRCTHMGGPVDLCLEGTLRCRWHGAEFDPDDGSAIVGEAPEGSFLKRLDVEEENGILFAVFELSDDVAA